MSATASQNAKASTTFNPRGLLFQADIIAGDEYLAGVESRQGHDPTKHLMLAVLRKAVLDFQKYLFADRADERMLHRQSELWIVEESDWFFSFRSICEVLRLDADYLRSGLLKWKTNSIRRAVGAHGVLRRGKSAKILEREISRRYSPGSLRRIPR